MFPDQVGIATMISRHLVSTTVSTRTCVS